MTCTLMTTGSRGGAGGQVPAGVVGLGLSYRHGGLSQVIGRLAVPWWWWALQRPLQCALHPSPYPRLRIWAGSVVSHRVSGLSLVRLSPGLATARLSGKAVASRGKP